nr:RAMP superfamily CRISPR-associated protein [uncultured Dethiosulfovibrio sp.]
MSRPIEGKIIVSGNLVAQTPLSVGGAALGEQVDLDLALNGRGEYYVPGSSLVGPMRSWMEAYIKGVRSYSAVQSFFGYQEGDKGSASHCYVEDAPFQSADIAGPLFRERRHGIGIAPSSGVAREGFLYTRAVLPRGTIVPLQLEIELTSSDQREEFGTLLFFLLEALEEGEIRIGAGKTRGYGKVKLQDVDVSWYNFFDSKTGEEDLQRWLEQKPAINHVSGKEWKKFLPEGDRSVGLRKHVYSCVFSIDWKPRSPLMVKSGRDGRDADMIPLVSDTGVGVVPVIPGSALKGAFRSHAEKIIRTLFCNNPEEIDEKEENQSLEIIRDLFGDIERSGRIFFSDLYCLETPMPQDQWLGENPNALNQITSYEEHVAIDRFTGGASNGALFNSRPVKKESHWEPILFSLDFQKPFYDKNLEDPQRVLSDEMQKLEMILINLLVEDCRNGMIPLGFGSRRGWGEISVKKVQKPPLLTQDDDATAENLRSLWQKYLSRSGNFASFMSTSNA